MLTRFLWSFCLVLMGHSLCAQDFLKWTPDLRLNRTDQAVAFIRSDKGFYFRRDQFQDDVLFTLEHYDVDSLAQEWSRVVNWPEGLEKSAELVDVVRVNGRMMAFFEHDNRKESRHELFANLMTPDGTWVGELRTLDQVPYEKQLDRSFELVLSPDSSHVMLALSGPFDRELSAEHFLSVYNADLMGIWNKRLSLPYSNSIFPNHVFLLDEDLNAHIFSGHARRKARQEYQVSQKEDKNHALFSYYWKDNLLKELEVSIRKRWITDAKASVTPSGLIGIGGYYSEGPYFTCEGTFTLMLDPRSRRIVVQGLVPFNPTFKSAFMSAKRAERGREINNLYLDHLHFGKDSSVVLLGELFDVQERVTSDPATGRQIVTYTYRYEDILCTRMNAKGEAEWSVHIPKSQAVVYEQNLYSGYGLMTRDDTLSVVFNDHPENFGFIEEARSLVSLRRISLANVDIMPDGELKRDHIFPQSSEEIIFRPELMLQLTPQRWVLFAQYKRNYRLGLIDFDRRASSVNIPD